MNIKVVYNKRFFKLPPGLQRLDEIRQAIQKQQIPKLPNQFSMYVQIDLCNTWSSFKNTKDKQDLEELRDDDVLEGIKELYRQQSWSALKILISDGKDLSMMKQDLDILNSSMMMSQSMIKLKQTTFQTTPTQTEEKPVRDSETQNCVLLLDSASQSKPEIDHKECQIQVNVKSQGQDPLQVEYEVNFPCFSCIGKPNQFQLACEECGGTGVHKDNQKLMGVMNYIIDKRLRLHNILREKEYDQIFHAPEIQVLDHNQLIDAYTNDSFRFDVRVKNIGQNPWPSPIELICVSNPFMNQKIEISEIVKPSESVLASFQLMAPDKVGIYNVELRVIDFAYFENRVQKQTTNRFGFKLNVKQFQPPQNLGQSKMEQTTVDKAKQMKEMFPSSNMQELIQFIKQNGQEKTVDRLTELYLQQK